MKNAPFAGFEYIIRLLMTHFVVLFILSNYLVIVLNNISNIHEFHRLRLSLSEKSQIFIGRLL